MITKELIGKSIVAGPGALQLVLATMDSTIELEEDLFIASIKNGPGTLKRMLTVCAKPFNVTKRVYGQAIEAGEEILSYLFPKSFPKLAMTESYAASFIIRSSEYGRSDHSDILESLRSYREGKLQITDKLMSLAKDKFDKILDEMSWIRECEKDISDEVAISGPGAFMELLNNEHTNFRVTKQIREVAVEHSYAFEALGLTYHSDVSTESLNLDHCVRPGKHHLSRCI